MCFPLFNCLKSWWKPGRLLASYCTLNFYKKSNMNLFKLVDKMHDKLLYSHYLHCTAYQCWRPGFPKAIYSTGNTSRKNLLSAWWCIRILIGTIRSTDSHFHCRKNVHEMVFFRLLRLCTLLITCRFAAEQSSVIDERFLKPHLG